MAEPPASKTKPVAGQRRYNVVLTGQVRKGFTIEQVSGDLARLAGIDAAQAALLLGGSMRVVKANVDQNTATQFQSRFEAIGAQCAIRPAATEGPPVERISSVENVASRVLTPHTIKAAFAGEIPRLASSRRSRALLMAVGGAMMLLPVLYATFAAGVMFASVWHALNNWDWFIPSRPGGYAFLVLYALLCVVGAGLAIVLFKPFFAPAADVYRPLKLSHQDDPLFFAFIDSIAQRVGAPMPVEIHVGCTADISVGPKHGFIGLYSKALVLTLGLPLVGGLTARQLAGCVARELGHFSRRPGLVFYHAVSSINGWFARCVHARDRWDGVLDEYIRRYADYRGLLLRVAKGAIWSSRKCMLVFLKLGILLSRRLERQMEFDADRFAACIAGSGEFRNLLLRGQELRAAGDAVGKRLSYNRDDGKLTDNFPKMLVDQSRSLPERYREVIMQGLQEQTPSFWSRYPSGYERIANADALAAPGIFTINAPGTALLARYERLCRQASLMHYRHVFGVAVKPEQLVSSVEVNTHAEQRETDAAVLKSYLAGQFWATRYLNIKRQAAYSAPHQEETKLRLDSLVRQVRKGIPDYEKLLARYKAAYDLHVNALAARMLAQHAVPFDAAAFNLRGPSESDVAEVLQSAVQTTAALEPELVKYESINAQRLALALAMRTDAQTQDDINRLLQALAVVAKTHRGIINLRCYFLVLDRRRHHFGPDAGPTQNGHDEAESVRQEYAALLALTGTAPYPFESKDGVRTISDYLRDYCGTPEQLPGDQEPLLKRIENICKCIEFLHERVMARLTAIAAEVEEKLGVEPLKQGKSAAPAQVDPDDIPLPF